MVDTDISLFFIPNLNCYVQVSFQPQRTDTSSVNQRKVWVRSVRISPEETLLQSPRVFITSLLAAN